MTLDVPYYEQTAEFSCGAACAVMALAHLDDAAPSRELEFALWREMNMIGVRGADPWGLSVPLLDRGFDVRVVTERERTFTTDRWSEFFEPEEIRLGEWAMEDNLRRARDRGVDEALRAPRFGDVVEALEEGALPIPMVHMGLVHGEDIPHWVVVTDVAADDERVTFHDPYPPKGCAGIVRSREEFWSIVEEIGRPPIAGARTLVVVG